ncbi:hypothetical protein ACHAWT_001071 [Skeletonema menzelii]
MVSLLCFKNKKKNKKGSSKKSNEDRGLLSPSNSSVSSPETRGVKTLSSTATKDTGYSASLSGIGSRSNQNNNFNFDDSSIPTIDSDYNQHNSNFSLSDAGGTIGSRSTLANFSHATSAFGGDVTIGNTVAGGGDSVERRLYNDAYMMSGNVHQQHHHSGSPTQLSHLIQPPTIRNEHYNRYNGSDGSAPQETVVINAPTGKLGVVIDTPNDEPIVHAVKDSSPIANKIQVGDKLIAVDEEDVTSMTAIQVSKLLARKSGQSVRKLTIVRTSRGRGGIY